MKTVKSANRAYLQHKNNARKRGIPFEFEFGEWFKFWFDSGKSHLRGQGKGRYCMARREDKGPYAAGNVFICEHGENSRLAHTGKHRFRKSKGYTIVFHKDKGKFSLGIWQRDLQKYRSGGFYLTREDAQSEFAVKCGIAL